MRYSFVFLSFVIGLFCVHYLSGYDKHEKEPLGRMFAVCCWGGAWSIIVSSILYAIVHGIGVQDIRNSFGALFVIGPVEESAKLLALFSSYFIIRNEMDEPTDGILYMACVALGFSLIENYFYATRNVNSGHLLLLRLFISTPMHIAFSIFMGLAFYVWKKHRKSTGLLFVSFLYASFVHGLYDLIIFNGIALIVLLLLVQQAYGFSLTLLSYTTAVSPYRLPLADFISAYGNPQTENGIECLHCGSVNPKKTYKLKKITIQKCDQCDHYVTTKKGIFQIFHHFASTFKKLDANYRTPSASGRQHSTLYANNDVSDFKKIASFELEKLNRTIEEVNASIIQKMEEKWWLPKNLLTPKQSDRAKIGYEETAIKAGLAAWKWLIYPFSIDRNKQIHIPGGQGPSWNWQAFIIPELWFLYHEIWGAFFLIAAFYSGLFYAAMHWHFNLFGQGMLIVLLVLRLVAGRTGNIVYYFRHGKWPIAAYNKTGGE